MNAIRVPSCKSIDHIRAIIGRRSAVDPEKCAADTCSITNDYQQPIVISAAFQASRSGAVWDRTEPS
jgi:hypothetical protein